MVKEKAVQPSSTDIKPVEQSQQNGDMKLKLGWAATIGTVGYSVYKLGTLPDTIKNERLYVTGAILGGGIVTIGAGLSAWGGKMSKSNESLIYLSGFTCIGGISYAITRGIFKQNPKNSLIASAVLLTGAFVYMYSKGSFNNLLSIRNTKQTPK